MARAEPGFVLGTAPLGQTAACRIETVDFIQQFVDDGPL